MAGRRRRGMVATCLAVLVLLGGYVVGDLYDVVPGVLTASPPPPAAEAFPTAPGAVRPSPAAAVLAAVDRKAPQPNATALAAVLTPLVLAPQLGPGVSATVVDALTGEQLYAKEADVPREPASVAKLLTAAAALHRLGPDATTTTRAVQGVTADEVVLVGGGDVLLSAGAGSPTSVNGRAGLDDLAAATAARLLRTGHTTVAVRLDDTLFTGNPMGPGWTHADVTGGFAAPVSSVAVDAGRTRDANYAPRVFDPAMSAAGRFAELLAAHGVAVVGPVVRAVAPGNPVVLAEVRSAPLGEVVGYMLQASDNNVAEALARLVARDLGRTTAFPDAARAVLDEVSSLGLDTSSARLVDGSGLGDGSALPASLLAGVLAKAASADHPELRPLLVGLPVAGLNGTLADRFRSDPAAVGLVRGKTGTLLGVTSLAGTVVDADGRLLAFAVLADHVHGTDPARDAVDRFAASLAACGCR
ncbi:MAG: D-alanyl-D-alanine carboxypeptidase/D-alanyl-D-alanine-endopeptidase [Actinomycetes bacterium]